MRVITQDERNEVLGRYQSEAATEATGLKIVLRSTAQLDGFPLAKAAFIRAAAAWEAQIKNPITIVIDVDYGPTRFGQTYSTGVLGSASTPSYSVSYSTIRGKLVSGATNADETTLYNSLPLSSVNTDIGAIGNTSVTSPLMRVFGLLAANADPATETNAPSIGFNSSFAFDFDPSDGIAADTRDFDAVAVHEMGHALGFVSNVGYYELYASSTRSMTIAGQTFTITQAGQPAPVCSYSVGAFNTALPSTSGSITIAVTTTSDCTWKAIENVSWLSFSNISTTTGTNTVRLSYASNTRPAHAVRSSQSQARTIRLRRQDAERNNN